MPECEVCEEAVTNPICPRCQRMQIETWLFEREPALVEGLRKKSSEVEFDKGSAKCIICNKKFDMCTYCYGRHILDWVVDYPQLIEEFTSYFAYSIRQRFGLLEVRPIAR